MAIEPKNRNDSENDEPPQIIGVEFERNIGVLSIEISLKKEMNSTYGARIRSGMHIRSKERAVPWKLRDNSGKRHTTIHTNNEIEAMIFTTNNNIAAKISPDLDLKDYARIFTTLHCQIGIKDGHNLMISDMVITALTQYHVS